MPELWSTSVPSSVSRSPPFISRATSAIDWFLGLRLSSTPTSPNWRPPSTSATRRPSSAAAATAKLTASVVRPTPPLGAKKVTTRPGPRAAVAARRRGPRPGAGRLPAKRSSLSALALVDLADRGGQLVRAERLDQELARAGEHRPAQVVGLALDAHHDDRRARRAERQLLGRGDAVHARHVDVEQHDVELLLVGQAEHFLARAEAADDLDVRLEAEQLGEVVARLGDVVDDDDLDLLGHVAVTLCSQLPTVRFLCQRAVIGAGGRTP